MYRQSSVSSSRGLRWALGGVFMVAASTTVAQAPAPATLARGDGSDITYYVKQAGSQPAKQLLVIMQGSDCNSVQNNPRIQDVLVPMLPNADVLTVEKYGVDASLTWNPSDPREDCPVLTMMSDSLSQRVQDYRAVLKAVQKRHRYDNVVVVGGSEGAVTAIMLAAESDAVDASIAFSGGGRWFKDDVVHSEVSRLPADLNPDYIKDLYQRLDFLATQAPLHAIVSGHGIKWWQEMLGHDQQAALMKTKTPVLVLQGAKDTSVDPMAVEKMINEVNAAGRSNVYYKSYAELNHVFDDAQGQSHFNDVTQDMQEWLAEVLPSQP